MYGTVQDWITYAAERGTVVEDNAASLAALVRASDYIRTRYVNRLKPVYDDQSSAVHEATYIAAAYELQTPGFWSKVYTPNQLKVLTKFEGVSWTPVSSGIHGVDGALPTSPAIENILMGGYRYNTGPFVV